MSIDTLVAGIKERRVILFVGAGVSMNLGLPSFRQLVSEIGRQLEFDPEVFHTLGDYLASRILSASAGDDWGPSELDGYDLASIHH